MLLHWDVVSTVEVEKFTIVIRGRGLKTNLGPRLQQLLQLQQITTNKEVSI